MNHTSPLLFASLFVPAVVSIQVTSPASETLPSGMIAQALIEGTGPSPKASDTVKVHYHGAFTSGARFDNSYKRGQPISFPLNRMVLYWTEGIQEIQVGGKVKLMCPVASTYGERGVPGTAPPNSTLNFEVELLGTGS